MNESGRESPEFVVCQTSQTKASYHCDWQKMEKSMGHENRKSNLDSVISLTKSVDVLARTIYHMSTFVFPLAGSAYDNNKFLAFIPNNSTRFKPFIFTTEVVLR